MKCNNAIQSFLESEDGGYIPFAVRWHIMLCRSCRNEIRVMRDIFLNAQIQPMIKIPRDMTDLIMRKIIDSDVVFEKNISFYRWLLAGLVILASMFLISYSNSFTWLKQHFGSGIEIPINIVLGLVISLYAASFIGTHIDEAKRFIEIINNKMHLK